MNRKDGRVVDGIRVGGDAGRSPARAEPLLIGEREAARLLGISPRLLWTLRTSNQVPFLRVNRRVLYCPTRLRAWVQQNTTGGSK